MPGSGWQWLFKFKLSRCQWLSGTADSDWNRSKTRTGTPHRLAAALAGLEERSTPADSDPSRRALLKAGTQCCGGSCVTGSCLQLQACRLAAMRAAAAVNLKKRSTSLRAHRFPGSRHSPIHHGGTPTFTVTATWEVPGPLELF